MSTAAAPPPPLSKEALARAVQVQASIDLSVARAQTLVASWLPARTAPAPAAADDDDSEDDAALFTPAPPRQSPPPPPAPPARAR